MKSWACLYSDEDIQIFACSGLLILRTFWLWMVGCWPYIYLFMNHSMLIFNQLPIIFHAHMVPFSQRFLSGLCSICNVGWSRKYYNLRPVPDSIYSLKPVIYSKDLLLLTIIYIRSMCQQAQWICLFSIFLCWWMQNKCLIPFLVFWCGWWADEGLFGQVYCLKVIKWGFLNIGCKDVQVILVKLNAS